MNCIQCGNKLSGAVKYCPICGAAQEYREEPLPTPEPMPNFATEASEPQRIRQTLQAEKKRPSRLPLLLGLGGFAVCLAVAVVLILFAGPRQQTSLQTADSGAKETVTIESETALTAVERAAETTEEAKADATAAEAAQEVTIQEVTVRLSEEEKRQAQQGLQALFQVGIACADAGDFDRFSSLCIGQQAHISEVYQKFLDSASAMNRNDYGNTQYFVLGRIGSTYVGYVYAYIIFHDTIYRNNTPVCFQETGSGWRFAADADSKPVLKALLPVQLGNAIERGQDFGWFNSGWNLEYRWATDYVDDGWRDFRIYFIWKNADGSASILVRVNNGWSQPARFSGNFRFGESENHTITNLYGEANQFSCLVSANSSRNVIITIPEAQLTEAGKSAWAEMDHIRVEWENVGFES